MDGDRGWCRPSSSSLREADHGLLVMDRRIRVSTVMQDRAGARPLIFHATMPDQMIATTTEPSALPDRADTFVHGRAEVRDNHPRPTDKQIDLLADVAADLRLAQIRPPAR